MAGTSDEDGSGLALVAFYAGASAAWQDHAATLKTQNETLRKDNAALQRDLNAITDALEKVTNLYHKSEACLKTAWDELEEARKTIRKYEEVLLGGQDVMRKTNEPGRDSRSAR